MGQPVSRLIEITTHLDRKPRFLPSGEVAAMVQKDSRPKCPYCKRTRIDNIKSCPSCGAPPEEEE